MFQEDFRVSTIEELRAEIEALKSKIEKQDRYPPMKNEPFLKIKH